MENSTSSMYILFAYSKLVPEINLFNHDGSSGEIM